MTSILLDDEEFGADIGEVSNFVTGDDSVTGLGHYELIPAAARCPAERRFPERLNHRFINEMDNNRYWLSQLATPAEGADFDISKYATLFCMQTLVSITIDTDTVANVTNAFGNNHPAWGVGTPVRLVPIETSGSIQKIRSDLYVDGYVSTILSGSSFGLVLTAHSGSGTFTNFFIYVKGTPLDTTATHSFAQQQSVATCTISADGRDNNFFYWPMLQKPKIRINAAFDVTVQPASYTLLQDGATFSLWFNNTSVGLGNTHSLTFYDPHSTIIWANGSPPPAYFPASTVNLIAFESFYSGSGVTKLLGTYVLNFR